MTAKKLLSTLKITGYDFDPDATTATDIAWVDMSLFENIAFKFQRTVGTSDLTVKILANSESDGSGTDVTVATITLDDQPDAVGDCIYCECSAADIAQAAATAGESDVRYVSLNLTFATGTDEGVVDYILANPKFAYDELTADSVA